MIKIFKSLKKNAVISITAVICFTFITLFTSCKKDPVKGWTFYRDSPPPPEITSMSGVVKNCIPPYPVTYYQECANLIGTVTYTWDFGDGTTSHDMNPMHIYNIPGTYPIRLIVSNEIGSDTAYLNMPDLELSSIPVNAGFSYLHYNNNNYAPNKIIFSNTSTGANQFYWHFGDGGQDNDDDPEHVFNNSGNYTVTLTGTCTDGTQDISTRQVFVNPAPTKVSIDSLNLMLPSGSGVYVKIYHGSYYVGRTVIKSGSFPIKYRWPADFIDGHIFEMVQFTNNEIFKFHIMKDNGNEPEYKLYEIDLSAESFQIRFYPRYYYNIEPIPYVKDVFIDLYINYGN